MMFLLMESNFGASKIAKINEYPYQKRVSFNKLILKKAVMKKKHRTKMKLYLKITP
jgi:hypothetical protein